eukprot:199900-Chlamydomonas_euryale.AAC.2
MGQRLACERARRQRCSGVVLFCPADARPPVAPSRLATAPPTHAPRPSLLSSLCFSLSFSPAFGQMPPRRSKAAAAGGGDEPVKGARAVATLPWGLRLHGAEKGGGLGSGSAPC